MILQQTFDREQSKQVAIKMARVAVVMMMRKKIST
jgi:hypothetical protein